MAKVLVVEDEEGVRWGIAKMLEAIGHVAIQSRNGYRALDVLEDNDDIELIVTDVSMPEMDGRQLIKTLRGREDTARIPIIIVSGAVGPKEIDDVLATGATAFLPKPVTIAALREYVDRYLGQGPE